MSESEVTECVLPSGDRLDVTSFYEDNLVRFTTTALMALDHLEVSESEVRRILQGFCPADLPVAVLLKVLRFSEAEKRLLSHIRHQTFKLNPERLREINTLLSLDESVRPGHIRNSESKSYGRALPAPHALPQFIDAGISLLVLEPDPVKRALKTFFFIVDNQLFESCNLRTAWLTLEGILLNNGFYPLLLPRDEIQNFHDSLSLACKAGVSDTLDDFMGRLSRRLYSVRIL